MSLTDQPYSDTADAAGTAVISIRPTNRRPWTVTQYSAEVGNFVSGIKVMVRKNGRLITPIILDTASGSGVAAGDPPVKLLASETSTVTFTGMTPGDTAHVWISYDDGNP